eukprot:m.11051 g.11051  ORF g.11051 m.11051 type:complete len:270 (-) comp4366_c0_seq1:67-876(-)
MSQKVNARSALQVALLAWLQPLRKLIAETDTNYPEPVHIGHALYSIASFRASRGRKCNWVETLVLSFLCYGNGGTVFNDLVQGRINSVFTHDKVAKYWLACTALVYYSPSDILYKMLNTPKHLFRFSCRMMDSIDCATTLASVIDSIGSRHPGNPIAPFLVGMALFKGGHTFRYIDARCRLAPCEMPLKEVDGGIRNALIFTTVYLLLRMRNNKSVSKFWMTLFYMFGEACQEFFDYDITKLLYTTIYKTTKSTAECVLSCREQTVYEV